LSGYRGPSREADHSPLSSALVKNALSYTSTLPIRLHSGGAYLSTGTAIGCSNKNNGGGDTFVGE